MINEQYDITQEERDKILRSYISDGRVKALPKKHKKMIVILQYIIERFESGKKYSEKDVNEIIRDIFDDYATVRRDLIEFGFMDRKRDCSEYWVKN